MKFQIHVFIGYNRETTRLGWTTDRSPAGGSIGEQRRVGGVVFRQDRKVSDSNEGGGGITDTADVDRGLAAVTTVGAVIVVSVAVGLDLVGADSPWMLAPTAVGVVTGYVIYRVFGDSEQLTGTRH